MMKKLSIALWFSVLSIAQLLAQPVNGHYEYGCKYVKNKLHKLQLTEGERSILSQADTRSDSIDILHFDIFIDLRDYGSKKITANCQVDFAAKVDGINKIKLDLLGLNVDSVFVAGQLTPFQYDGSYITIPLTTALNAGEESTVHIYYQGTPVADPSGFGGLVFEDGIIYNLGIGLSGSTGKYNYGRGWFPCFDNFVERATYDFTVMSGGNRKGYCIGTFLGEEDLGNGVFVRHYSMAQQLPTYLVGIAAGNYKTIEETHQGASGDIPVLLVGKTGDTSSMKNAFQFLGDAIDAFEDWYGDYFWEQVGYVMTTAGAMEHSTLIAFPDFIIDNGPSFGMNRLMAHELAHHWWGNRTTLSGPENMWIKEGNAEYGAHLFTEYTFGKEAFKKQVMDNWEDVLKSAHIDDDGFQPLSGIPYEQTYGTTTYNKGASIMHNLRAYLGDSLFSSGMTALLEHFTYQSINAEQFRDFLSAETGYDLHWFFNDQIFQPGFSNFEINKLQTAASGNVWNVELTVRQKVRAAPVLYTNVPLQITFFDEAWNEYTYPFVASGTETTVNFELPFQPVLQVLNDKQDMNLARLQNRYIINDVGTLGTNYTDLYQINVTQITDSALLNIVHHWVAPDPITDNPNQYRLSNTHFWSFTGDFKGDFAAKVRFAYSGSTASQLDYDLVSETEDSLLLMYRPDAQTEWMEYPYYEKQLVGANNGFGFVTAEPLLMGDYCFANGQTITLPLKEYESEAAVLLFPNPVSDVLRLTFTEALPDGLNCRLKLMDAMGRSWKEVSMTNQTKIELPVANIPKGAYFVLIEDEAGNPFHAEKISIQ